MRRDATCRSSRGRRDAERILRYMHERKRRTEIRAKTQERIAYLGAVLELGEGLADRVLKGSGLAGGGNNLL